jgi:hypothetical protein
MKISVPFKITGSIGPPLVLIIFLLLPPLIIAQGGGGGGKTAPPNRPAPTTPKPQLTRKSAKSSKETGAFVRKSRKTTKEPRPIVSSGFGTAELSVSEPESEIFLSDKDGSVFEQEWNLTPPDGSPLSIDALEEGTYTLTVRKNGFIETTRQIRVVAGRNNAFRVTLQPSTAFMTVSGRPAGSTIAIENVGEFEGAISRQHVPPGRYRIDISKTGFVSESRNVQITRLGEECSVLFELQPLPIDRIIAEANAKIAAGDYAGAEKAALQVIQFDPSQPKANLIIGLAKFFQGETDSTSYFMTVLQMGESVSLPVKLVGGGRGNLQLVSGVLTFDRYYIAFDPETGRTTSFRIFKSELAGVEKSLDKSSIPNVNFRGKGEYGGKKGDRRVYVYPRAAELLPNGKDISCVSGTNRVDVCGEDGNAIHKLIYDWQNKLR